MRKGLLFAGTERGLYVSFDDGVWWQPFQRNLPVVPITDLTIKDGDLVVATQGRAFWILDDLSPLRQWFPAVEKEAVHVFKPRPAVRFGSSRPRRGRPAARRRAEPAGGGDRRRLAEGRAAEEAGVEGRADARDPRRREGPAGPSRRRRRKDEDGCRRTRTPKSRSSSSAASTGSPGTSRMLKPSLVPKAIIWGPRDGPLVAPGTYSVPASSSATRCSRRRSRSSRTRWSRRRPRTSSRSPLFSRTFATALSETHEAALTCRDVKKQVKDVVDRAAAAREEGAARRQGQGAVGEAHRHRGEAREPEGQERAGRPELPAAARPPVRRRRERRGEWRGRAAGVVRRVPRASSRAGLADLRKQLQAVLDTDLADFNKAVQEQGIPAVAPGAAEGEQVRDRTILQEGGAPRRQRHAWPHWPLL